MRCSTGEEETVRRGHSTIAFNLPPVQFPMVEQVSESKCVMGDEELVLL